MGLVFIFTLKLQNYFEKIEHIYVRPFFFVLIINNILFMYLSFFVFQFFFIPKLKYLN